MCFRACRCVGAALISVLLGFVIGILYFNSILTGIIGVIIAALIFSALTFLILTIIGVFTRGKEELCTCREGKCTLLAAVLNLILGIVAISLTLAVANIGFAILVGLLGATFIFNILSLVGLLTCLFECERCNNICQYNN